MTCSTCNTDAFLHCVLCHKSYCVEHKCSHLADLIEDYENEPRSYSDEHMPILRTSDGEVADEYVQPDTPKRHWLSYGNIIAEMPDDKLRNAISRYKILIREMEQELLLRSKFSVQHSVQNSTVPRELRRKNVQIRTEYICGRIQKKIARLNSFDIQKLIIRLEALQHK